MNQDSFRLESLQLFNHKLLGDIEIDFFKKNDCNDGPFTTLIIGPNGTGKSEILRSIIHIFRELEFEKYGEKNDSEYKYRLSFFYNEGHYEINKKDGMIILD